MRIFVWTSLGLLSAALCGCGGSVGGGSSGGDGGTGQGGMGQSSSGQGGGSAQGSSGQGGSAQAGTGQGGGGSVCGGFPGTPCATGEYCDFPDDQCGDADGTGVCAPLPQGCPTVYMPVCACDGMVYSNACEAHVAGKDVANAGGCAPPAGTFSCGPEFCAKGQQYCSKTGSDVPGIPDSYSCPPLPPECFQGQPPTCACLDGVCGAPMQNCTPSPDGDLTVICPGG
jgi:hypothetical protein